MNITYYTMDIRRMLKNYFNRNDIQIVFLDINDKGHTVTGEMSITFPSQDIDKCYMIEKFNSCSAIKGMEINFQPSGDEVIQIEFDDLEELDDFITDLEKGEMRSPFDDRIDYTRYYSSIKRSEEMVDEIKYETPKEFIHCPDGYKVNCTEPYFIWHVKDEKVLNDIFEKYPDTNFYRDHIYADLNLTMFLRTIIFGIKAIYVNENYHRKDPKTDEKVKETSTVVQVLWEDGTSTKVICMPEDEPDIYNAVCIAAMKKVYCNNSGFKKLIEEKTKYCGKKKVKNTK